MSMPPPGPGQPGRPQGQPHNQPPFGQLPLYGQQPPQQPPFGQQPPYGQQPPAGSPYGAPYGTGGPPPRKGGVPVWAWVVGGIALVLVLCLCGGIGVVALSDDESSSSSSTTTQTSTTDPTTSESSSTSVPPTSTTTSSTTTPTPSSSAPPTPAGSTANTNTSLKLPSDEVETQIAKGMKAYGHTKSDISCPTDLVLVAGRKAFCTAPVPGKSGTTSTVTVEVVWAANVGSDTRYYLSFHQPLS